VTNLNRIFINPHDMADTMAFTTRTMDLMLKDPTGTALEDVVNGLRMKRAYQVSVELVKGQMAAVMKSVGARGYEQKKLIEICTVSFGERITKAADIGSLYPVYGSGEDTFKTDKYNRVGKTCKLARFAVSEKSMVIFINDTYWLMDSGFTVDSKDESLITKEYLWWSLMTDKKRLVACAEGSCQKNIEMDKFYDLKYSVPPLPIQQEVLTILNTMEAERTSLEQMAEKTMMRTQYILDAYLT
jgi:restriction endonuclease S subunit